MKTLAKNYNIFVVKIKLRQLNKKEDNNQKLTKNN